MVDLRSPQRMPTRSTGCPGATRTKRELSRRWCCPRPSMAPKPHHLPLSLWISSVERLPKQSSLTLRGPAISSCFKHLQIAHECRKSWYAWHCMTGEPLTQQQLDNNDQDIIQTTAENKKAGRPATFSSIPAFRSDDIIPPALRDIASHAQRVRRRAKGSRASSSASTSRSRSSSGDSLHRPTASTAR